MTCQKSHHLPFDYSLFPPVLTLITAALIIVCFVVLLLMPFPGVPLAGRAVVNGASEAVSALAGFHPGRETPGLQRPFRSRRLCRAVACAPYIPAKGRRDVRRNAVSQTALHVVAAGPCPLLCPVPFTCLSPCRRGQRQPQPSPPVQGGNVHPAKLFAQKQAKTFAVCPRTVVSCRGSDAPCGEGSQKGDGEYQREQKAGPRKTSKPRLPKLKR